MAYFEDLTTYRFSPNRPPALNVGWLAKGHEFHKGQIPKEMVEKLGELRAASLTNQTRGYHSCDLCQPANSNVSARWKGNSYRLGSAELWIKSDDGVCYAAPDLILHYLEVHIYRPPEVFLKAVELLRTVGSVKASYAFPWGRLEITEVKAQS